RAAGQAGPEHDGAGEHHQGAQAALESLPGRAGLGGRSAQQRRPHAEREDEVAAEPGQARDDVQPLHEEEPGHVLTSGGREPTPVLSVCLTSRVTEISEESYTTA